MKKTILIVPGLLALIIITGCAKTDQNTNQNQNANSQNQQQTRQNSFNQFDENFVAITASDFKKGDKVLVTGTTSGDGTITAERIIFGNSQTDFDNFGQLMRPTSTDRQSPNQDQDQSPPAFNGQRPDFSNMTDEQRQQMIEQMQASGQMPAGMRNGTRGANQQMTRIQGEILDIDEESITVKIEEGGSKLIFFSETTSIVKIKE